MRDREFMKRITVGFVALALVLTACGSAAEVLTEQVAEQAIGGGDVKIDTDSGEVSVETEDGSIVIGGGELPDGFDVPLPDGYRVTSVITTDEVSAVSLAYPDGDWAAIEAFFDDWTSSQPSEWSKSSSSISGDEGSLESANWIDEDGGGIISMSSFCLVADDSIDEDNCIAVNVNTGKG